jgi:hypothetical protein
MLQPPAQLLTAPAFGVGFLLQAAPFYLSSDLGVLNRGPTHGGC